MFDYAAQTEIIEIILSSILTILNTQSLVYIIEEYAMPRVWI